MLMFAQCLYLFLLDRLHQRHQLHRQYQLHQQHLLGLLGLFHFLQDLLHLLILLDPSGQLDPLGGQQCGSAVDPGRPLSLVVLRDPAHAQ